MTRRVNHSASTPPKSDNPNNPDCSRAVQMVLDLKRTLKMDVSIFDTILDYMDSHHDERDAASDLMVSHEYNQNSIVFDKKFKQLEYRHYITPQALCILDAMICIMRTNNCVRMSQSDMIHISPVANKATAAKAVGDLIKNGCIAVVIQGTRNRSAVYMVNPEIAVCGKNRNLEKRFWKYTGTEYTDSGIVKSEPHILWDLHESEPTFSIGSDKQITEEGMVYFNKVNEPCIKVNKNIPSVVAPTDGKVLNTGVITSMDYDMNDISDGEIPI